MVARSKKPAAKSPKPTPRSKAAAKPKPTSKPAPAALREIGFPSIAAWSAWLAEHHDRSPGIWMRIARKGARSSTISYAEALEVALAWGWIDGQKGKGDAEAWLQKFTLRGPRSIWSKINVEKANALIERGEMKPSGLAAVERAKANGQWERAYASPSRAEVPEDLAAALDRQPRARAFFDQLESFNRYAILHRLYTAKNPETRARRIETFVEMCARGEKLHPAR
ncbi:MAG: YdeI/OmpD-associated family protein [Kofleriaceae bacterium]